MTSRWPGTRSTISYVYASRRPRKRATKSILEPTAIGGGVCQETDSMLAYQSGALLGSAAYAATWPLGRSMMISVTTSTAIVAHRASRVLRRRRAAVTVLQHRSEVEERLAP